MRSRRLTKAKIRGRKRRRLQYLFNKNVIVKLRRWHDDNNLHDVVDNYLKTPVKGYVFSDYLFISSKLLVQIKSEGMDRYMESCNRLLYEYELLKSA